jgi:hypothetical protein
MQLINHVRNLLYFNAYSPYAIFLLYHKRTVAVTEAYAKTLGFYI